MNPHVHDDSQPHAYVGSHALGCRLPAEKKIKFPNLSTGTCTVTLEEYRRQMAELEEAA